VEITKDGKRVKFGIKGFSIHDGYFKEMLYSRIRDKKTWFVPFDISDEYCKQVTAESLITDGIRKGWIKTYKDNHYLDCEKFQMAAATLLRIDLEEEKENVNITSEQCQEVLESRTNEVSKILRTGTNEEKKEIVKEVVGGYLDKEVKEYQEREKDKILLKQLQSKEPKTNVIKMLQNKKNIGINVWGK